MSWIRNNWKALALLAGGLAAIAILTTIILVTREDRGLIVRECSGDGVTAPVRWPRSAFPVPVWIEESDEPELRPLVQASIEFWHKATGLDLFDLKGALAPHQSTIDPVVLVFRSNAEDHGKAKLKWIGRCVVQRVEVSLPGLAPEGSKEKAAIHEFGHVLGLDHDDYEDSVMYPKVLAWGLDSVTDADRELLRKEYGP